MKRTGLIALVLCLILAVCTAGFAETFDAAAVIPDTKTLEKYASFAEDASTGLWSVNAYQADAGLMYLRSIAGDYTDGVVYLYPSVTGSAETAMLLPVLNVIYTGASSSRKIGDATISVAVGESRYDFTAKAEKLSLTARADAELYRIPLDAESIGLLDAVAEAEEMDVLLCGEYTFTADIRTAYKNATARETLYTMIFDAFAPVSAELEALGIGGYGLWDLNDAYWTGLTGEKPAAAVTALNGAEQTIGGFTLSGSFEAYYRGNRGENVRKLQERMIELGFMGGKADTAFGLTLDKAVRSAQRYMGMPETGLADAAFLNALEAETLTAAVTGADETGAEEVIMNGETEAAPGVRYVSEGAAAFRPDRAWFARSVTTLPENGAMSEKFANNGDNVLLALDGSLTNLSASDLKLYTDVTGTVSAGDYSYALTAVCERDNGTRFDTQLMPLGEARVVLYAEVPAALMQAEMLTVRLEIGGNTLICAVSPR